MSQPTMFSDERVFDGGRHPVRYLLRRGHPDSQHALLMFSGFNKPNEHKYNYVRTLKGVRSHRIYVLDDLGPRGSYYLGSGREFFVEEAIVAMLDEALGELGLTREQVTTAGSSKGGTAAIWYAVRHGFGEVVAGGPQTYIGNYLTKQSPASDVAELMAGGTDAESVTWLNRLLFDAVRESSHRPSMTFFTSEKDTHYRRHLVPMLELLEAEGYTYDIVMSDYTPHSAVGGPFSEFLRTRYGGPADV